MTFQGTVSFSSAWKRLFGGAAAKETEVASNGGEAVEAKSVAAKSATSFSKGILPCLAAAFISGLAGALSQKGVQMAGGTGRNAYLYTVELSVFSSISLLFSMFATKNGRKALRGGDGKDGEGGFFRHWTLASMIPITVRALGGVLTALVHKYAGATRKGFALIGGLVLTGVIQSLVEGERLSTDELLAMAMVILSSYLHISYPPRLL